MMSSVLLRSYVFWEPKGGVLKCPLSVLSFLGWKMLKLNHIIQVPVLFLASPSYHMNTRLYYGNWFLCSALCVNKIAAEGRRQFLVLGIV